MGRGTFCAPRPRLCPCFSRQRGLLRHGAGRGNSLSLFVLHHVVSPWHLPCTKTLHTLLHLLYQHNGTPSLGARQQSATLPVGPPLQKSTGVETEIGRHSWFLRRGKRKNDAPLQHQRSATTRAVPERSHLPDQCSTGPTPKNTLAALVPNSGATTTIGDVDVHCGLLARQRNKDAGRL